MPTKSEKGARRRVPGRVWSGLVWSLDVLPYRRGVARQGLRDFRRNPYSAQPSPDEDEEEEEE